MDKPQAVAQRSIDDVKCFFEWRREEGNNGDANEMAS